MKKPNHCWRRRIKNGGRIGTLEERKRLNTIRINLALLWKDVVVSWAIYSFSYFNINYCLHFFFFDLFDKRLLQRNAVGKSNFFLMYVLNLFSVFMCNEFLYIFKFVICVNSYKLVWKDSWWRKNGFVAKRSW